MSILDLAPVEELQAHLRRRTQEGIGEVSVLDSPLGPGRPWPPGLPSRKRFPLPFRPGAAPFSLVMAKLAEDPQMSSTLAGYDIALLDTSELATSNITPEGLYAVYRRGEVILRYLRPGAESHYLVSDATLSTPAYWEQLKVSTRELAEIVKGRVLWIGRERDRDQPANQRGRFF